MKINNCKLCEIYDDQKLSGDKNGSINSQSQFCRHTATFLSQTQLALAFHLLRGYYQPAGPLISPHLLPPPPSLEGEQQQQTQPTSQTTGENDPDVMITGGDLAPRPHYRYGPPPAPDFSRPLHPQQMHYPPSYPPYYYGQHPPPPPVTHQDLCYPYYPPKYYPTNSPYARRPYVSPGYYQPPPLVPQNAPQQIVPAAPTPQHIDPHYSSSPYYPGPSAYNTGGQCYNQTPPRNLQPPYLDAHQYHSSSCPCPMQSCQSKNVHTGTGPTKAKGPVSASNGLAETLPKTSSQTNGSAQPTISCKIENILSPTMIKPETDKIGDEADSQKNAPKTRELYEKVMHTHAPAMSYTAHDTLDLSPSPSRGSIGIQQIPSVQHEASVQPTENNINSDNASISHRKQARIGKSMERDRQQQQHQSGYNNHLIHNNNHHHHHHHQQQQRHKGSEDVLQFKQEYPMKKESDMKKEKDCDEISMTNFNHSSAANIKIERPENQEVPKMATQTDTSSTQNDENFQLTVNLTNESSDECGGIDYTIKRKHNDCDDVIELSDNSSLDPPALVKRRKLLEKPISTPKKSPPNSYKSLIKQSNSTGEATPTVLKTPSTSTPLPTVVATKPKLIPSKILNKSTVKRRSILKSKSTFKTMRFTVKAKRRALHKKKQQLLQQRKRAMAGNEKSLKDEQLPSSSEADEDNKVADKSPSTPLIEDDNSFEDEKSQPCEAVLNETSENNEEKSMDGSSEYSGKSNIDLTIDRVAKGYFSESEIFSSLSKHRKTKSQKRFEAKLMDLCVKEKKKRCKDKSLSVPEKEKAKKKISNANKEIQQPTTSIDDDATSTSSPSTSTDTKESQPSNTSRSNNNNNHKNVASKKTTNKKPKKTKAKEPKEVENKEPIKENKKKKKKGTMETSNSHSNEKDAMKFDSENAPSSQSTPKRKQKAIPAAKKISTAKKTKTTADVIIEKETEEPVVHDSNDNIEDKTIESKDLTSTTIITPPPQPPAAEETVKPLIIDETDVANNNNEYFENHNNKQKHQEPLTLYKTPGQGWTTALARASKRGKKPKYTNRKKIKLTLNDIVIPKSTSIPRWSNGWVWEGEPYQALVFLNSDDPPVPRTCYDSMRHEECGDVIRPRDCVLLRAGGKRNELPYVAKVAQLWENPEDGEMMMSLFWYYRPEHTEQGRQVADAVDEVFASRHKDHNSVACIEDKCYVITYNEYCRYRKMLKSVEENIEEPLSLVPKLHSLDRRSVPPPTTSPELIMFCRRVYDFRGKRLMDDKKKK